MSSAEYVCAMMSQFCLSRTPKQLSSLTGVRLVVVVVTVVTVVAKRNGAVRTAFWVGSLGKNLVVRFCGQLSSSERSLQWGTPSQRYACAMQDPLKHVHWVEPQPPRPSPTVSVGAAAADSKVPLPSLAIAPAGNATSAAASSTHGRAHTASMFFFQMVSASCAQFVVAVVAKVIVLTSRSSRSV